MVIGSATLQVDVLTEVGVQQFVAGVSLQPVGQLILCTQSNDPTVHRFEVVACAQLCLQRDAQFLAQLLVGFSSQQQTTFTLCRCCERQVEEKEYGDIFIIHSHILNF